MSCFGVLCPSCLTRWRSRVPKTSLHYTRAGLTQMRLRPHCALSFPCCSNFIFHVLRHVFPQIIPMYSHLINFQKLPFMLACINLSSLVITTEALGAQAIHHDGNGPHDCSCQNVEPAGSRAIFVLGRCTPSQVKLLGGGTLPYALSPARRASSASHHPKSKL